MPTPAESLVRELADRPVVLTDPQARRAYALLLVHFLFPVATPTDARRIAEWIVKGVTP